MKEKMLIKDIKQKQIGNFKMISQGILKNDRISREEKKRSISDIIIKYLDKYGEFYKTKNQIFYFFDKELKTLYQIHKEEFKYLLNICFQVNQSTDTFKYLMAEIESYMSENSKLVEIYNFSYYDLKNNILYIHNNGVNIIKISADKVEKVDNGYNGLIFETNYLFQEWDLIEDENLKSENHLENIIESINFDTDSKVNKQDYCWLLENYIYGLFFPNILNTRPILAFIGNKGSGKSFFLKLLLYIFYGKEVSLTNLPSNDEEFKNSLMNNYLYFIDNLDDSITKTKVDILCSVATGVGIKKRVLYTTSNELNVKINSFIAITSRTPKFKRVDLNERLLIFKLESLKTYISETELFNKINRDRTMTNIVYRLHKILANMGEFKYFHTNFRLADFSNLVHNLDINNIGEKAISNNLKSFTREQEEFTLESEPLIDLLEILVQDNNSMITSYTAKQLHIKLKEISSKSFTSGMRIPYSLTTPISLGKKLRELESGIKSKFSFEIKKGHSNITNYIFSGIK